MTGAFLDPAPPRRLGAAGDQFLGVLGQVDHRAREPAALGGDRPGAVAGAPVGEGREHQAGDHDPGGQGQPGAGIQQHGRHHGHRGDGQRRHHRSEDP